MTLNITKKKIEKVLELFNHPQTRKIRKNRGKKRRRNNKSFNRKNGRKNLATSTLKKRGGHGHPLSVGGTVGVVLGGQVGGDIEKTKKNFQNFITKYQLSLQNKYDNYKVVDNDTDEDTNDDKRKTFLGNILMNLKSKFGNKKIEGEGEGEGEEVVSPFYDNPDFKNIISNKSDKNSIILNDLLEVNENKDKNNIVSLPEGERNMLRDIVFPNQLRILPEYKPIKMYSKKTKDYKTFTPDILDDLPDIKGKTFVTTTEETKTVETKSEPKSETKEIDTSEMLKVALASNYFTQYGILSGMLKMNQENDKDKFDVMNFVQDPKLYAEFCNKMGFQFAEMSENVNEETVVENKTSEANQEANQEANSDTDSEEEEKQD